ncbi:MAG: hypothetical protein KF884_05650 [Fimbriimonadaceae bacterium]|nr:hypothetical protein [Fimbriimonadaceae bacterium]QYK59569.1 MAG: hypothetical protein KF884_05650 [Fimbriimonadaceae bacterium]
MAPHKALTSLTALLVATLSHGLDEGRFRLDTYDFDQRRGGLPGGGNMYCVPTSFANVLAYLRKYGNSQMLLGFDPASHAQMTSFISYLGILLDTDPEDGTSGAASKEFEYVGALTNKLIFFGDYGPSSNWGYKTIMNKFRAGALVQLCYGRYKPFGDMWDRDGGHCLTLMGYDRRDSQTLQDKLYMADPAQDDGDNSVQSPFIYKTVATANLTLHILGQVTPVTHARYSFKTGPNGDRRYLIDRMMVFHPTYVGWSSPSGDRDTFTVRIPYMPGPVGSLPPQTYSVTPPSDVRDWCFDPADFGLVSLSPTGAVDKIDVVTETSVRLYNASAARQVAVGGPDQSVYVLLEGQNFDSVARIAREGGRPEIRQLPGKAAAIDVDEKTGGVVALDSDLATATAFDPDFAVSKRVRLVDLAPIAPLSKIATGEGVFRVDSDTGDYYVAVRGTRSWNRYPGGSSVRMGKRVTANLGRTIREVIPGPQGTVFVQDDANRIYTFGLGGDRKFTDFDGLQALGPFEIPKSFNYGKPELTVGPKWRNENPVGDEP